MSHNTESIASITGSLQSYRINSLKLEIIKRDRHVVNKELWTTTWNRFMNQIQLNQIQLDQIHWRRINCFGSTEWDSWNIFTESTNSETVYKTYPGNFSRNFFDVQQFPLVMIFTETPGLVINLFPRCRHWTEAPARGTLSSQLLDLWSRLVEIFFGLDLTSLRMAVRLFVFPYAAPNLELVHKTPSRASWPCFHRSCVNPYSLAAHTDPRKEFTSDEFSAWLYRLDLITLEHEIESTIDIYSTRCPIFEIYAGEKKSNQFLVIRVNLL